MTRLTVVPMPFKARGVTLRKRNVVDAPTSVVVKYIVKHTPLEWLKLGLTSRRHEKKGWLRQMLLDNNELHPTDEEMLWNRVISDFKCQESYREGMKEVLGLKYKDPRDYKGMHYWKKFWWQIRFQKDTDPTRSAKECSFIGIPFVCIQCVKEDIFQEA
jgi:hypothetical protein